MILDKDLVRGLSEKEVEIEHLKTTVVALQEKVVVSIQYIYSKQLSWYQHIPISFTYIHPSLGYWWHEARCDYTQVVIGALWNKERGVAGTHHWDQCYHPRRYWKAQLIRAKSYWRNIKATEWNPGFEISLSSKRKRASSKVRTSKLRSFM